MILLPRITLICIDTINYGKAVSALQKSLKQITPARCIFLTNVELKLDGIEVIQIPAIKSKKAYSEFVIKELTNYFYTDFVLLIQHDGYVINGASWNDEFYNSDFIGAPWLYNDGRNVGNGGVSLRSKRLQNILATDDFITTHDPEDEIIGRLYRHYLEKEYDIKFPDEDTADKFSYELRTPIYDTFAFHGDFHKPYQKTVIISRKAALGDVIQVEPVLEYFHSKGYRVVLDTLPQFYLFFVNHYFKVHHPDEIDLRLLNKSLTYNLDMSYESKPKQLHLKTYFEFCSIADYTLRNPKLSMGFNAKSKEFKLFPKYCILHIDKREQASRNIEGVDWYKLVQYLISKGYTVIQLGRGEHIEVSGAIQMNTINETILSYVCAGADLFIGIDSGISHICSGYNVPSVICFGNVNPEYIHADMSNKICLTNNVCNTPFCWHDTIGCEGTKCYIDNDYPPCNQFSSTRIIEAIEQLCN